MSEQEKCDQHFTIGMDVAGPTKDCMVLTIYDNQRQLPIHVSHTWETTALHLALAMGECEDLRRQLAQANARIAELETERDALSHVIRHHFSYDPSMRSQGCDTFGCNMDVVPKEVRMTIINTLRGDSISQPLLDELARLRAIVGTLHAWIRRDVPADVFGKLAEQCRNDKHSPCYCGCHTSYAMDAAQAKKGK